MSFNINNVGRPVCIIKGGQYNNHIICYSSQKANLIGNEKFANFKQLVLEDEDAELLPFPNTESERDIVACFGPSGSGKSYFIRNYVLEYQKLHKKNPQYCISLKKDDKSFSELKKLEQLELNDTWIKQPLELADFGEDCLIILDDTDTVRNKDIKNNVDALKNQILEVGRDKKVTCLVTSHLATKGKETKTLLNEAHQIVIYLSSGANYKTLLENYLGLSTKQIQKLKDMETRYIVFVRQYPMILYTQKQIMFLKDL